MTPASPPSPRLAALAVLPHQCRVLLVRRRNPPDQGLWGYPGGKVEFGETVMAAAIRELAEETGIHAAPVRLLAGLDVIGQHSDGSAWHFFLVPVLCRYLSGEAQAGDDAADAAWFPNGEILTRAHPMSADVDHVLREALHEAGITAPDPL